MVVVVVVLMAALELLPHVVGVLAVGVVLSLDVVDLEAQGGGVEVKGGAVTAADVEGDVFGAEDGFHGVLGGSHELGCEAKLAVGTKDSKGGNVAVAGFGGVLLHLGEDIADNLPVVVLGDEEELRPREDVVEIILHLVVLR